MGFEGSAQCRAHRNHPPTAAGLWGPKLPIGVCFRNLDVAAQEIKPVPPELIAGQQYLNLRGYQEAALFLGLSIAERNTAGPRPPAQAFGL
ncbi:MAG: hypothetical protein AUG89_00935 [Acidobacteria bacterium 13_1_20CM_4_56_7]|nr:MAG: hypothetical protein AUG89_00935 [Acidobacteria bacterium 13_1_20CM_4_56_7]